MINRNAIRGMVTANNILKKIASGKYNTSYVYRMQKKSKLSKSCFNKYILYLARSGRLVRRTNGMVKVIDSNPLSFNEYNKVRYVHKKKSRSRKSVVAKIKHQTNGEKEDTVEVPIDASSLLVRGTFVATDKRQPFSDIPLEIDIPFPKILSALARKAKKNA